VSHIYEFYFTPFSMTSHLLSGERMIELGLNAKPGYHYSYIRKASGVRHLRLKTEIESISKNSGFVLHKILKHKSIQCKLNRCIPQKEF
jgi:hypothetical protein